MIPSIDYSPSSNESNIDAQDGDSFGEVLAHTVLIHLLRCVQFLLESSSKALPIPEIGKQNISRGAIGFSLFNYPEPTNTGKFPSSNAEYSADIISHLLTSICALLADCRQSALESTMIIQRIEVIQTSDQECGQNKSSGQRNKTSQAIDNPADITVVAEIDRSFFSC